MKIILFTHPDFLDSQSMPRYQNMIVKGMVHRGHDVEVWSPKARFFKLPLMSSFKKWLGYIDQYIVFPLEVKFKLRQCSNNTLFVFADQALGPWVPMVKDKLHIVHCHDFLALKAALGFIPENPTGLTGKLYQNYIRNGFSKGKNFICVSQKTHEDLKKLHRGNINTSTICYNGVDHLFKTMDSFLAREILEDRLDINLKAGYFVHIGGNQYYKNRKGVLEIYEAFRASTIDQTPLLLIGSRPSEELNGLFQKSNYREDIHFITDLADEYINAAYSGATCLIFPSLDEGFGWPIAEAMASGCLVLTTNESPMTEVIGNANFFMIPRRPFNEIEVSNWALKASSQLVRIKNLTELEKENCVKVGLGSVKRFNTDLALDTIEKFYFAIETRIL